MKIFKSLLAICVLFCLTAPLNKAMAANAKEGDEKVKVYYFHNTRRCFTCNTVEKVAKEAVKSGFAKEMGNGIITFQSLNIEEKEGKDMANKLDVSGQALLVVSGDKKVDLTTAGFMNAVNKPEKLKSKIKGVIEEML